MHHVSFNDIPKLLDTPYFVDDRNNRQPPCALEIEMLRQQQFNPVLKNKVMQQ
ncbi:hypothetical protein JMUB7488_28360 [Staphylococcus aureus]